MSEAGARRAARCRAHLLPQGDPDVVVAPWRESVLASGGDPGDFRAGICRHFVVE
jgi:hypothetical protein